MMNEKEKIKYCVDVMDKVLSYIERNIFSDKVYSVWGYNLIGWSGGLNFKIGEEIYSIKLNNDIIFPFVSMKSIKLGIVKDNEKLNTLFDVVISDLAFVDKKKLFKRMKNIYDDVKNKNDIMREQKSLESLEELLEELVRESI